MGLLELKLLGPPLVEHGDRVVDFRTRKALAMLAYMCLEPGMHTRQHLAALLWPDSDRDAARANLRSTLMYLRKPLGHSEEGQVEPHLQVTRDALGFNFESRYQLDLDLWRELPADLSRDQVVDLLEASGGDFMQGFSVASAEPFEEWLRAQRERWRVDLAGRLDRITNRLRERNLASLAQRCALRWTELDPYSEAAHRRLMRCQWADGDRSGALRTYRSLTDRLQDELGVEPTPETQALADQLRRASGPEPAAEQEARRHSAEPPLARLPFVGREEAHSRLVRAFHAARQRGGQAAIVEGEAGIGKTRLAREFLPWARTEMADVLHGRASEAGPGLPYQPVVNALRPTLSRATRAPEGLDEVWLGELARIFPEVKQDRPDLEIAESDATRALRLYESVFRLTDWLARDSTLVLFVDNLQWAEAGTVDLLAYLSRRWVEQGTTALLLTCMRSDEFPAASSAGRPRLSAWRRSLEREVPVHHLTLSPLSEAEVHDLMLRLLKGHAGPSPAQMALLEWVFDETQGQPFYLTETLKALVDRKVLVAVQDGDEGPRLDISPELLDGDLREELDARELFPHGIKEVVRGRLDRLPPDAADLLAAGAVLADGISLELAREIAGLDESAALRALDVIQSAAIWTVQHEAGAEGPEFVFAHDKIRDVVYTDAGPSRRRLYHQRAFDLLQERGAPEAELAHHAYAAGRMDEAFHLSLRAGRSAFELSAVRPAISRYETAYRILKEHPKVADDVGVTAIHDLYRSLGRAHELVNDWESARAIYREFLGSARERERLDLEAKALIRLSGVHLLEAANLGSGEEHLEQAIQVARRAEDERVEAEAQAQLAHLHFIRFEREQAAEHARRAIELAEAIEARDLLARALNALSYALAVQRPAEEVEAIAERARRVYRELGDRAMEIDCSVRVATLRQFAGRSGEARALLEESVLGSRDIENDWGLMNGLNHLASVMMDLGRLGDAVAAAEESTEIARTLTGVPILVNSLTTLGFVYREAGRPQDAVELHQEAERATGRLTPENFGPGIAAQLSADYAALDEWGLAERAADRALKVIDYSWIHRAEADPWLLGVLLRSGRVEEAARVEAGLAEAAEGNLRLCLPLRRCQARLAVSRDDPEIAVEKLRDALATSQSLGLGWPRWNLLNELSWALRTSGRSQAAREADVQARALLEDLAQSLPDEPGQRLLGGAWQSRLLRIDEGTEG